MNSTSYEAPCASTAVAATHRWHALDWLRFLAVVMMVQGHSFTALMNPAERSQQWFAIHNYVHGYTAPIFFFAAGLAFGFVTLHKWERFRQWGIPMKKRLVRYGWILFIGYVLHIPNLSLHRLVGPDASRYWDIVLQVNALQHIAVVMMGCTLCAWLCRQRKYFLWLIGLLGVLAVGMGPWAWRVPIERILPDVFAAYFNANTGSIFPLIPWMGFICFGIVAAGFLYRDDNTSTPLHYGRVKILCAIAVMLVGLSEFLHLHDVNPFGAHNYWKTSPWFFGTRLGVILAVLCLFCGLEYLLRYRFKSLTHHQNNRPSYGSSIIEVASQESLFIYVVHLMMLYGSPLNRSLTGCWGEQLSVLQSTVVTLGIFLACALLTAGWHWLKTQRPRQFQWFKYALLFLTLAFLVLNP